MGVCVKRFLFISIVFLLMGHFSGNAQTTKVDEIQQKLKGQMADTSRLRLLIQLSSAYSSVDPEKKLFYARRCKNLAKKLGQDSTVAEAYIDMGTSFALRNQMDSALYYFSMGYDKAKAIHHEKGVARSLVNSGFVYSKLNNEISAVNNYLKALDIFKKIGHSKGISQCNINIGSIYFDLLQYKLAETYFLAALKSYTETNNELGKANAMFSLGNTNNRLGNYEKAAGYFNKSLVIREKAGDLSGIALSRWGLGSLDVVQHNYKKALQNLKIARDLNVRIQNPYNEVAVLISITEAYVGLKDYKMAKAFGLVALEKSKGLGSDSSMGQVYNVLVTIADKQNDFIKAFHYQTELIKVMEKQQTERTVNNIMVTDFKRVRSENDDLLKHNKVIVSKNTNYVKTILATLLLLLLVFLLLLLYYRRNREKIITNKLLQKQKEEIANINTELGILNKELNIQMALTAEQNVELAKLNAVKNKFFSIVSHDLRSPLSTLQMLFRLYREGGVSEDEMGLLLTKLEDTIYTTGTFLDNLLEWSKSQLEGMTINPSLFNISNLIVENINLIDSQIKFKELNVQSIAKPEVIAYADPNMINVVVRNLLSNSVKFCNPGDSIVLDVKEEEEGILFCIRDTGPGISIEEQQKLFSLEHSISTGTYGEKGHHIGLILCKDMLKQNNGDIRVESEPGKGTIFRVRLPKSD